MMSPGLIPYFSRSSWGIVICPLDVTFEAPVSVGSLLIRFTIINKNDKIYKYCHTINLIDKNDKKKVRKRNVKEKIFHAVRD